MSSTDKELIDHARKAANAVYIAWPGGADNISKILFDLCNLIEYKNKLLMRVVGGTTAEEIVNNILGDD